MTETPMEQTGAGHNWSAHTGDPACLRCGTLMLTLDHELRETAKQPCPGRNALSSRAPQAGGEGAVERVAKAICCPGGYCQARGEYDPIRGNVSICQAHTFEAEAHAAIAAVTTPADAPKGDMPEGQDEPCYYCGEPCNALAGNPSLWPIPLCHRDDPGVTKWHHTGCVTDRLIENQPAPKGDVRGAMPKRAVYGTLPFGVVRAAPGDYVLTASTPSPSQDEGEALRHLRNVLYYFADIHPDDRCGALDNAQAFHNERCPNDRIEPSHVNWFRLVPADTTEGEALRSALFLANRDKESILRRLDTDIAGVEACPKSGEINETLRDGALGALRVFRAAIVEGEWTAPREHLTATQKLENIEDAIVDSILAEPAGAEVEALRRALEPFAKCVDIIPADVPDGRYLLFADFGGDRFIPQACVGDLRRAREALSRSPARCLVTGNPVGTDTWQAGNPCQCLNCQAFLAAYPGDPEALQDAIELKRRGRSE